MRVTWYNCELHGGIEESPKKMKKLNLSKLRKAFLSTKDFDGSFNISDLGSYKNSANSSIPFTRNCN